MPDSVTGAMARVFRELHAHVTHGVPLLDSLTVVARECGDASVRSAVEDEAAALKSGGEMWSVLGSRPPFSDLPIRRMLTTATEAGMLDRAFVALADGLEDGWLRSLAAADGAHPPSQRNADLIRLFRQVAAFVDVGMRLPDALGLSASRCAHVRFAEDLTHVAEALNDGAGLGGAVAKHVTSFPPPLPLLLDAIGQMELMGARFAQLADALDRDRILGVCDAGTSRSPAISWLFTLGLMMSVGVPLLDALQTLGRSTSDPVMGSCTEDVLAGLSSGGEMSVALRGFPELFTESAALIVQHAEVHGRLDETLCEIAEGMERGLFLP